jgi:hypothetical protein
VRLERAGLLVRAFGHGGSVVAITASGRRAVGAGRAIVRAGATHGMGCGTRVRCRGSQRC